VKGKLFSRERFSEDRPAEWRWALFSILSLTILMAAWGCRKQESTGEIQQRPPAEVTTITITPRDIPIAPEFIAQVQSSWEVNVQARVNGFLEKHVYTEGALVKEGQTLFLMDRKPFQAQLDQAKAALAMQQASLEVARLNLARTKPLAEQKALSQKDLDNAVGQFQTAAAGVAQAKAQVEQASLNLSYTVITSPVTGVSSSVRQMDGAYVDQSNSLLTTVSVLSPMWVNFSISENEWHRFRDEIAKGLIREPSNRDYVVEIVFMDDTVFPHTGRLTFAEFSYSQQTGTFLVRATVDNPEAILRPNMFVRVRLKGAVRPNAILVPQRAVQQNTKGKFVWVVDSDNKVYLRPVEVGNWHDSEWFISQGLKGGEQVVVDGVLPLRPAAVVKITPMGQEATVKTGEAASTPPDKKGP
jgi:membrane fusion protein, multidrug efflux system